MSCTGDARPPLAEDEYAIRERTSRDGGAETELLITLEDPSEDTTCGEVSVELTIQRPNFYFVLDASESMDEDMPGSGGLSRYQAARLAIADMMRSVGHRINVGAATFPAKSGSDGCSAGEEVFPVIAGDPQAADGAADGPVLNSLLAKLSRRSPWGATPTAATLELLAPQWAELEGKTSAFLLTDGAPNCDVQEPCSAADCILNIEGASFENGPACAENFNCCAQDLFPHLCLDKNGTTQVISELRENGVQLYVLGIPGSEIYADVLNAMAQAAGTERDGDLAYYRVTDAADLALTLLELGRELSRGCELDLGDTPARRDLVNVFADDEPLVFEADNGWVWTGDDQLLLTGEPCEAWKSGETERLNVFEGCPVVAK